MTRAVINKDEIQLYKLVLLYHSLSLLIQTILRKMIIDLKTLEDSMHDVNAPIQLNFNITPLLVKLQALKF